MNGLMAGLFVALNAHYGKAAEGTSLCAKLLHTTTGIRRNGNMTRKEGTQMDRLAYRDDTGRARLTRYGMQMYCSTQATADCFAKLEESIPRWISVKDRLPENEQMVIGYTPVDGYMFIGFHKTEVAFGYDWSSWFIITSMRSTKTVTKKVTHWMPLPEPPKEELV